ncbi:hypothetical protein HDU76_004339 [Blyttiomyces sp. JEL0837]|nr:hypothetical protein HDU76_004339 [Blyttiomyces sp. JEL0837]
MTPEQSEGHLLLGNTFCTTCPTFQQKAAHNLKRCFFVDIDIIKDPLITMERNEKRKHDSSEDRMLVSPAAKKPANKLMLNDDSPSKPRSPGVEDLSRKRLYGQTDPSRSNPFLSKVTSRDDSVDEIPTAVKPTEKPKVTAPQPHYQFGATASLASTSSAGAAAAAGASGTPEPPKPSNIAFGVSTFGSSSGFGSFSSYGTGMSSPFASLVPPNKPLMVNKEPNEPTPMQTVPSSSSTTLSTAAKPAESKDSNMNGVEMTSSGTKVNESTTNATTAGQTAKESIDHKNDSNKSSGVENKLSTSPSQVTKVVSDKIEATGASSPVVKPIFLARDANDAGFKGSFGGRDSEISSSSLSSNISVKKTVNLQTDGHTFGSMASTSGLSFGGFASAAAKGSKSSWISELSEQGKKKVEESKSQVKDIFKGKDDGDEGEAEEDDDGNVEEEVPIEKKTEIPEIETVTGEENDDVEFQMRCKLFSMDENGQYKEKGVGILRLNVNRDDPKLVRIVMRNDIRKTLLNMRLTPGLPPRLTQDKVVYLKDAAGKTAYLVKTSTPAVAKEFISKIAQFTPPAPKAE